MKFFGLDLGIPRRPLLVRDEQENYLSPHGTAYRVTLSPVGNLFVEITLRAAQGVIPNTALLGLEDRVAPSPRAVQSGIASLLREADALSLRFGAALAVAPASPFVREKPVLTEADLIALATEIIKQNARTQTDRGE
jgi:hypothetical protein